MESTKGRFLVVEGLEGSGKSTAIHTLKRFLNAKGIEVLTTREPGGTPLAEKIRELIKADSPHEVLDARTEVLLFYAARVQLLTQCIRPALQRGVWVLSDRFELSTFAYQGGGRQLDLAFLEALSRHCVNEIKPDFTFFLNVPPEIGLRRAQKRGKLDRIEQESLDFFRSVDETYRQCLQKLTSVAVIDAGRPLAVVQRLIREAMQTYLSDHDVCV